MTQTAAPKPSPELRRGGVTWLLSPRHFHLKLLSGTAVGIVVIAFLAALFLFVTLRNHHRETLRTFSVDVVRLSGVIGNDIAALETNHRGFLLTGDASYVEPFERQRELLKHRIEQLTALVLENSAQRKRIMKIQEIIQKWLETVALPQINARQTKGIVRPGEPLYSPSNSLGNSLLDQAREILQSIQNEEQIILHQRTQEQEWAVQSIQVLDLLTKLERSLIEMEKEKSGYLLAGETGFAEAYRRATTDFNTYCSYLSILLASSPERLELLGNLRKGTDKWIQTAAVPEMEAKRSGKEVAAFIAASRSKELMAEVRDTLRAFERKEVGEYEKRSNLANRDRIIRTTALAILCLLAVSLLIVSNSYSFVLVRRQLTKLEGIETRIRSIIENILDGMITVDEKGSICSMNPAAEKMFGCINNELIGHKFTKLVPKSFNDTGEPMVCAWDDLARLTGTTIMAVGRTRRHATLPIEISLSEMVVDRQKLFVAMVRDVTERKRFEKEIAADKESLAVTLRSIEDGVITTDVQGKIIMINKAGEQLTGWSSRDAIGQLLKSVFNIAIDLAAQARAQTGYRNEAHSILLSMPQNATLKSRDGTERLIEQVASPIRDDKNEVAGVVLVFRDITERQRNEAERRKAEALEQLGLLAGGIAHDFNNLLTAIIGNISLASLILPPDGEMSARLNDAKNASLRARDLAQQLLTFARGGAPIKKTASIGKLIQDTVSFSLRGSQSRPEFSIGDDLRPADIDPGQISQVIANLVVNADQAMPKGGTLHITCDNFSARPETDSSIPPELAAGDYIRISIRDEGVGIPENCLKRIFDPYFTTKAKGNGLGLATTYSIIKNHNGLITVESELHCGSTFTLYLPASKLQQIEVEPPRQMNEVVTGSGRVLIVDDEEAIRDLVEFTLDRLGYQVSQAESALKGIEIYRQRLEASERFDLVILDLTLPGGMGGKECLKKLMEIDPTVNAIVSSGYALDATMSRYQDHGFRGVIAKPYEAAELGRIVHDTITSARVEIVPDYEMQVV